VPEAHRDLRRIARLAEIAAGRIDATSKPKSPRRKEQRELRGSATGGRARADLLDKIAIDGQLLVTHLILMVDGVADCFEVAASRDMIVNVPALTTVVRAAVEVAGQLAWLFDQDIDGADRGRRFLRLRFADLKSQRLLMRDLKEDNEFTDDASVELAGAEAALLKVAADCGWAARPTVERPGSIEAAALLGDDGKAVGIPTNTDLVKLVVSTPSLYGMLSSAAHGNRFGILHGLKRTDKKLPGGKVEARFSGFGLDPNVAIGVTALAVDWPCRLIGSWDAIDVGDLHANVERLMVRAGIR
jgi:hypothetical protein